METTQTKPPQRKMEVRTVFWVREVRRRQSRGMGMIQIDLYFVYLWRVVEEEGGRGRRGLHVKDNVDAAGGDEEFGDIDAVAGGGWVPELLDRGAFEDDGEGCSD